eukprot:2299988-Amphidinium_carterae.1
MSGPATEAAESLRLFCHCWFYTFGRPHLAQCIGFGNEPKLRLHGMALNYYDTRYACKLTKNVKFVLNGWWCLQLSPALHMEAFPMGSLMGTATPPVLSINM